MPERDTPSPLPLPATSGTDSTCALHLPLWRAVGLKLPLKTTILLLTLLIAVVGMSGAIFLGSTRSMLEKNKASQVSQFAYGVAAVLGEKPSDPAVLQRELEALGKTPNLQFAMLTTADGASIAGIDADGRQWVAYREGFSTSQSKSHLIRGLGEVRTPQEIGTDCYAVSVPVFDGNSADQQSRVLGYLHIGISNEASIAQLHFLQAFVLLTCMAIVLVAVPIAGFIARHITVPIQRLAAAAHALAGGDLSHRVTLDRADELGELAAAFNRMADTVQQQQEDIKEINAGLEKTVQARTAELEKLNKRLTSEMADKEDFLRAVSHDLNAPLRNIAGMASMLVLKYQNTLEKDALQRLERIQKNVDIECELINELLELSRIKTRREKIEQVELGTLVDAVAEGFSADLETRRITLRREGSFPVMNCEKSRFRQVFQNLIDNAIKYMRQDSEREIVISVHEGPDEFTFRVSDTGMGIAAEDLPQLFHVFRRAKNASMMKIPGKGVGLASVKSIIENYSGRLWAESVQGRGTTFHMALPKSHFEVSQEAAA